MELNLSDDQFEIRRRLLGRLLGALVLVWGGLLPAAARAETAILQGLDTIPWAPTCPHGRPVAILVSHDDLELRFRRR